MRFEFRAVIKQMKQLFTDRMHLSVVFVCIVLMLANNFFFRPRLLTEIPKWFGVVICVVAGGLLGIILAMICRTARKYHSHIRLFLFWILLFSALIIMYDGKFPVYPSRLSKTTYELRIVEHSSEVFINELLIDNTKVNLYDVCQIDGNFWWDSNQLILSGEFGGSSLVCIVYPNHLSSVISLNYKNAHDSVNFDIQVGNNVYQVSTINGDNSDHLFSTVVPVTAGTLLGEILYYIDMLFIAFLIVFVCAGFLIQKPDVLDQRLVSDTGSFFDFTTDWRCQFLSVCLLLGSSVFLVTEILGIINLLIPIAIKIIWGIIVLLIVVVVLKNASRKSVCISIEPLKSLNKAQLGLLLFVGCILMITLLTGVFSSPNNYDSLTYHLTRVEHWFQNRNVDFYPTHNIRQNISAPWAEYAILNLNSLCDGDRLSFLVQWVSMLGSLVGVSLITKLLGGNRTAQIWSVVFTATIPMAILQSISTQNDLTVGFWLVCMVASFLLWRNKPGYRNAIAIGISAGLAVLTKATAYIYIFPFMLWGVILFFTRREFRKVPQIILMVSILIGINALFMMRNWQMYHNLLGDPEYSSQINNTEISLTGMGATLLRNTLTLAGISWESISEGIYPFGETGYQSIQLNVEDIAPGPVHLLAIFIALGFELVRAIRKKSVDFNLKYGGFLLFGYILFCSIVQWQPWINRLLLPMLLLASPFVSKAFSKLFQRESQLLYMIAIFLIIFHLPIVFTNRNHPLIGDHSVLKISRIDELFLRNSDLKPEVETIISLLEQNNCRQVGLVISSDSPEYPFFVLTEKIFDVVRFEHVMVTNESGQIALQNFEPCAIISNNQDEKIVYQGQDFIIQTDQKYNLFLQKQ